MKHNNTGQIIKSKTTEKFTIIPNEVLNNKTLSLKAKGLLCILLSLPSDWVIYKTQLQDFSMDGRDSTINTFNELVEKGYILSVKRIDEKGRFMGYDYIVYDKIPDTDIKNPIPENPKTDNPKSENPSLQRTNRQSTNEQKTNVLDNNTGTSILGNWERNLLIESIEENISSNEIKNILKLVLDNCSITSIQKEMIIDNRSQLIKKIPALDKLISKIT